MVLLIMSPLLLMHVVMDVMVSITCDTSRAALLLRFINDNATLRTIYARKRLYITPSIPPPLVDDDNDGNGTIVDDELCAMIDDGVACLVSLSSAGNNAIASVHRFAAMII